MRSRVLLSSCVFVCLGGIATADEAAPAAETTPPPGTAVHYTVEAASVSSYVWRGSLLSADRTAPAIQPYGELDLDVAPLGNARIALGVWTSRSVTGDNAAQEIDPYLWVQVPVGDFLLRAGYIVYVLPDLTPADTMHELSAQVTWVATPTVSAVAGLAVDPIRTEGGYAFAQLAYARTFGKATLTVTGNAGASKYDMQPADLQDLTLTARGAYGLGDSGLYVAATAAGAYSGRDHEYYPYAGLSVGIAK